MIGYLAGKVKNVDGDSREVTVFTTSGVGYCVRTNMLVNVGDEVELYVYTAVSENNMTLWGFVSAAELKVFKLLLGVSGVGPATAASVIYNVGVVNFLTNLLSGNLDKMKVPGLGTKTLQKITIELKSKVEGNYYYLNVIGGKQQTALAGSQEIEEAILGLAALGYDIHVVRTYFTKTNSQGSTQELIKKFLSDYK